ncbi:hypothetical protein [Roseomonas sp. AR75]|uniref:hypothetical protein n=1 Tax=Roseomonas sp. AR75 TaxID=2562311 RepID=UPI0010C0E9D7|nr:hypothetical protein [Roseomonas sp. AR75]
MSDIDDVFASFRDEKSASTGRRGTRIIPQRGTRSSRTIEVVHVRSGATPRPAGEPRHSSFGVRAAAWDDGFPAKQAPPRPAAPQPPVSVPVEPTFHIMPPRSPSTLAAEAAPVVLDPTPVIASRRGRGRPRKQAAAAPIRRFADPFDASDEGANCLR